jgi:hypothetical protein
MILFIASVILVIILARIREISVPTKLGLLVVKLG